MEEREKEESRPRLVDFIYDQLGDTIAMKADGLDDAIIGIGSRCGQVDLLVYDKSKVIEILMERDEMTDEEALEFYSFNIEGAWVGEGTPIWLERFDDYE